MLVQKHNRVWLTPCRPTPVLTTAAALILTTIATVHIIHRVHQDAHIVFITISSVTTCTTATTCTCLQCEWRFGTRGPAPRMWGHDCFAVHLLHRRQIRTLHTRAPEAEEPAVGAAGVAWAVAAVALWRIAVAARARLPRVVFVIVRAALLLILLIPGLVNNVHVPLRVVQVVVVVAVAVHALRLVVKQRAWPPTRVNVQVVAQRRLLLLLLLQRQRRALAAARVQNPVSHCTAAKPRVCICQRRVAVHAVAAAAGRGRREPQARWLSPHSANAMWRVRCAAHAAACAL